MRRLQVTRWLAQLFAGLFAGFLLGVLVLEAALRDSSGADYLTVRSAELEGLDRLATATLLPAVVSTIALVVMTIRGGWSSPRVALILLGGVLVLSVIVNLPINSDQLDWDAASLPADWRDVRDRWQLAHAARTVAAIAAFALLILPHSTAPRRSGDQR